MTAVAYESWSKLQRAFAYASRGLKAIGDDPRELLFRDRYPDLTWDEKMQVVKHMNESEAAWEYPADWEQEA